MSTITGVGFSEVMQDSAAAGTAAAQRAIARLAGKTPSAVLVFCTEQFDEPELLKGIRSVTGSVPLIGCTAAGVIVNGTLSKEGVSVAAIHSDTMKVSVAVAEHLGTDAHGAGAKLAEQLAEQAGVSVMEAERQVMIMLSDASMTKAVVTDVIKGAHEILGASVSMIGGGSSDNLHFKKSSQFLNDIIYTDAVVGMLLVADSSQSVVLRHGWRPTSDPMVVTKAVGKTVYELNGIAALSVYMEHIAQDINTFEFSRFYNVAMTHPFGIPSPTKEGYLIRDPLSASKEDGSITFVAEVPQGSTVQIMGGGKDTLLQAGADAAAQAKMAVHHAPALVFVADCVSRLLVLGDDTEKELRAIADAVGADVPMIGFFSFGEVGSEAAQPAFHNKTCALYVMPE